jgi:putative transposase
LASQAKAIPKRRLTPRAKIIPITEHYQHFLAEMKESFWGDVYGETKRLWKERLEADSQRQGDRYAVREVYQRRSNRRQPYRNGGLQRFQRRAEDVSMLIREAFLRGISTRQVGRVVATLTGEVVSPQTVSKLTRDLDEAVKQFHQARLSDDYAYLFLDGVSLRVRRPAGRKRVQMLVAYGVRRDGTRHLLAFLRSQGESQADWEALLQDMYRRGLEGEHLSLIVTDGCPGLAAALRTVYPRVRHQRCWAHKMRNILEKVKKADYDEVKRDAQAIYTAESQAHAAAAFRAFRARWRGKYGPMVRQLERDLPELLSVFALPAHLRKKLRTTNVIERCFVEVRRRTRPMVCFVNVKSVDRILYSIFQRFNLEWKTRTLSVFTQAA